MLTKKARPIVSFFVACNLPVMLAGCALAKHYTVGDPKEPPKPILPADNATVSKYFSNSITWCEDKERALIAANTGLNVGSDVVSLIFSAVGSIINPVATAHLFSAGATVATGLKTTIANDVTSSPSRI